jgi:hypothetical protein
MQYLHGKEHAGTVVPVWRNLRDRSNFPRWFRTSYAGGTLFSASVSPAFSNSSDRPPKSEESGATALTTARGHDQASEPFDARAHTGPQHLVGLAEGTPGLPEHGVGRVRADSSMAPFDPSPWPCADSPNTSSSSPKLRAALLHPWTFARAVNVEPTSWHHRSR